MELTEEQESRILAELERWSGLRHIDRRAEPGRGIDCIHLVFQAWFAAGLIERKRLPSYSVKIGLMSDENIMGRGLELLLHAARLPQGVPAVGDAVIWRAGNQSNHAGIVAPARAGGPLSVWHVMKGGVVHPTPVGPVVRRAQELVRIIEPGWKMEPSDLHLRDIERGNG